MSFTKKLLSVCVELMLRCTISHLFAVSECFLTVHTSFPVTHKVDNVGIFVQLPV